MRRHIQLLLLFNFILISAIDAATIYATQNGNWSATSTWLGNIVPGDGDIVIINGYEIIIDDTDGNVSVSSITLGSSFAATATKLTIRGAVTVNVSSFFAYTSINYPNVSLDLENSSFLTVNGDMNFNRSGLTNTNNMLQLNISNTAKLRVTGDFQFSYNDSGASENNPELNLTDTGEMEIVGDMILELKGGKDLTANVQSSAQLSIGDTLYIDKSGGEDLLFYTGDKVEVSIGKTAKLVNTGGASGTAKISANQTEGVIQILDDLIVYSSVVDRGTAVELNSNSALDVNGDIILYGLSEGDVYLSVNNTASLNLGGSFHRPNKYGSLFMNTDATLVYDGTDAQTIACSDIVGSGTDNFVCSNIRFNNSAADPMILEGDWVVSRQLELTRGVIQTSDTAMLIIGDGAQIIGGSNTAYIDGPMQKVGTSKGSTFLFPIGNNNVYAPLEIDAVTNTTYMYQAQYFSCPPPLEDGLLPPISNISGQGFWEISRSAGATDVGVALHWDDADAAGIGDPDSLLVAGLTDNGDGTTTWNSYGNGGVTGGVGTGVSGSVSNAASEPPPMDDVTKLTLGSTDAGSNALPVILADFRASSRHEQIILDWTTIMEEDSDYFAIERSTSGIYFSEIGQVTAKGTFTGMQSYTYVDRNPQPGVNYYRLKQVDLNGNYQYSPVVSEQISILPDQLQAIPTIVQDKVTLSGFNQRNGKYRIELYHQNGSLVYAGEHEVQNGLLDLFVDEMNLQQKGMYFFVIKDGQKMRTTQIILNND